MRKEKLPRGIFEKMERVSACLGRIMLSILIFICAMALLLAVNEGVESPSYLAALAAGAVAAGLLLWLGKRKWALGSFGRLCGRLGAARCAAVTTGLCFVLGLVWIVLVPIEPFSDYQTYWDCAVSIARGEPVYSTEYVAMYPHILGYASFLALFIKIFGEQVLVGVLLGLILSCLSGLLIFSIAREAAGLPAAVLASGLWALYPGRIMLGSLIFSEPLYTCLLLLFLFLLLRLRRKQEKLKKRILSPLLWGLGLGLLLESINAVRPIGAILIIALLLWLLFLRGGETKDGKLWRFWLLLTAALLLGFQLSGKLWNGRLEDILGEEPAGLPIYNLYVGFNMDTLGQWSGEDMDLLFEYRRQEGGSAPQAQKSMLPHVLERLRSEELDLGKLFSAKLFTFLGNDELGGYTYRFTRSESFVKICMVICNCFYYMLLLMGLTGLTRLWLRWKDSAFLLLPLYTLGLTLAHMLIEVSSRYHYSLIPMFIIFAALCFKEGNKNKGETT